MTSTKVRVELLEEKIAKLEKRLKKDEKRGVLEREERPKREPSDYNIFISKHINEMPAKTSQERFAECVKLWQEEKKKKDGKKPKRKAREEELEEEEEEEREERKGRKGYREEQDLEE
jgi:hypothetical protein